MTLTDRLRELKELTDPTKDRWHAQRFYFPRLISALEKAIEQRDHYVEVAADHEPFKKDLMELNKQITEILADDLSFAKTSGSDALSIDKDIGEGK